MLTLDEDGMYLAGRFKAPVVQPPTRLPEARNSKPSRMR